MEAITIYNRQELAQNLNPGLLNDFVQWIDRSDKTTRSYLTNLRQFMSWLNYAGIQNPQRSDIIAYRQWLSAEHEAIKFDGSCRTDASGNPIKITCKPNTVAQYLRSVCQFFRWTAANNLYPDIAANIHAPQVKNDTHRKSALTVKEVLTIEESIAERAAQRSQAAQEAAKDPAGRLQRSTEQGKRLYAMYLLAVNAGLRTVEISRANIKDLETKSGQTWLYIWGKGRTEPDQRKPLAPEVAAALKDYINTRSDRPTGASPLFVSTGNRSGGKRIATTTISTMLKRAMQEAGFDSERLTAHSLRHSAAQAALQASGDNIYTAQKYLRHSSPTTTEIYLHEDERTEKAELAIAQDIYNLYHGNTDRRGTLEQLINKMTPQQLERLTSIAAAMA